MFFFQGNFFILLKVFILTQNLNTVRTATEMKQNLLHWILPHQDFNSFIKLLNISLDEYSLFLSHLKSVF